MLSGVSQPFKLGIVGLDTSHAMEFVKIINNEIYRSQFQIIGAYPFGNSNLSPRSEDRIKRYSKEFEDLKISIYQNLDDLHKDVDGVLLETNDGGMRLEQARKIFNYQKPVFLDKPIGSTWEDVYTILTEAKTNKVPVFSSSALRYIASIQELDIRKVKGCEVIGPLEVEKSHSYFYWYGIHGIEMMVALMGLGCVSVKCISHGDFELVEATWKDGRKGQYKGVYSSSQGFGGQVFLEDEIRQLGGFEGYENLVFKISEFFLEGISEVSIEETLEIYAIMEAAGKSKELNGLEIKIVEFI
ncbi:MAG: Gfo/Idh/MocA family oxidoreductase [Cyclobacteriaceae bacterium]|nr:Gfo/Idh/MocA family oxidoreductase [Cyclobacteriaceae bacterium]